VAIKRGGKCRVQAISGQDTIENRSNIVAALNKLATRVVAAGEPLWHDGTTEDLPPQIEEALEDYVDQSYGRNIAVLPLRQPQRDDGKAAQGAAGQIDRDGSHRGEVIGALIVEQIESDIPPEVFRARVDLVYEHGTRAIANSLTHSNLFLMPVWRTLGRMMWLFRSRTLPKTLGVIGLITAGILALIFVPLELQLEAEGTIEPDVRREVFAPIDGEVTEVLVDHAAEVKAGQVLVNLRNPKLELELAELLGQIQTATAELSRVRGILTERRSLEPNERQQLQGEELEFKVRLESLRAKLKLQQARTEQLVIRAPIDGTVVTWDVEKTLRSRPVMTGQVLLEIADMSQPMHLELKMPDKRMSHLDQRILEVNEPSLPVEYVLATDPDAPLLAQLPRDQIQLRAQGDQEHGSIVKMRAIPEPEPLAKMNPRPGAKVIADVRCGKRASGFVLFHEIYEWLCKFFF
jgi:biotin carboxyl carrier protein